MFVASVPVTALAAPPGNFLRPLREPHKRIGQATRCHCSAHLSGKARQPLGDTDCRTDLGERHTGLLVSMGLDGMPGNRGHLKEINDNRPPYEREAIHRFNAILPDGFGDCGRKATGERHLELGPQDDLVATELLVGHRPDRPVEQAPQDDRGPTVPRDEIDTERFQMPEKFLGRR